MEVDQKIYNQVIDILNKIQKETFNHFTVLEFGNTIKLAQGNVIKPQSYAKVLIGEEKYTLTFQYHVDDLYVSNTDIQTFHNEKEYDVIVCMDFSKMAKKYCNENHISHISLGSNICLHLPTFFYQIVCLGDAKVIKRENKILKYKGTWTVLDTIKKDLEKQYTVADFLSEMSATPYYRIRDYMLRHEYAKNTGYRRQIKMTKKGKEWVKGLDTPLKWR